MKYDHEKALAMIAALSRRGHAMTALILSPRTRIDHLALISRRSQRIHEMEMLMRDLRMLILFSPTP